MASDPVNEALSILTQLDNEARAWEAQNRARLDIRKVLAAYQDATKVLKDLESSKQNIINDIESLKVLYAQTSDNLRASVEGTRREVQPQIEALQAELLTARESLKDFQRTSTTRKQTLSSQIEELEHTLSELRSQHSTLLEDLTQLKARHGLGG